MKTTIIILILSMIILTGCNNYSYKFNNEISSSECIVKCSDMMKDYRCMEVVPSYQSSVVNDNLESVSCECALLECSKKCEVCE